MTDPVTNPDLQSLQTAAFAQWQKLAGEGRLDVVPYALLIKGVPEEAQPLVDYLREKERTFLPPDYMRESYLSGVSLHSGQIGAQPLVMIGLDARALMPCDVLYCDYNEFHNAQSPSSLGSIRQLLSHWTGGIPERLAPILDEPVFSSNNFREALFLEAKERFFVSVAPEDWLKNRVCMGIKCEDVGEQPVPEDYIPGGTVSATYAEMICEIDAQHYEAENPDSIYINRARQCIRGGRVTVTPHSPAPAAPAPV